MKLYLSSMGIIDEHAFLSLFGSSKKTIGLIANAWGPYPPEKRQPFIDGITNKLRELGFEVKPINLLEYAGKNAELKKLLQGLQGVWVTGGNTFFLNWAVHQAGLHDMIRGLCEKGLVYGGESAGAALAGTTLHGIEHMDDPKDAPTVTWEGLGLVDYGIVPHWDNAKYMEALRLCKKDMAKHAQTRTITDDEYIVVNQ